MSNDTLAQLLAGKTQQEAFALLLGLYQANGFPAQSWQAGGVERTRAMAIAAAASDFYSSYMPAAAGGALLDYSSGDWLTALAKQNFTIDRNPAITTIGNITLTIASGVAFQPFLSGRLIAVFAATGQRFRNTSDITMPIGPDVLVTEFEAEFAGAASNANPSSSGNLTLVTPIPGVTLSNPATTFTRSSVIGTGTGLVVPSGSPVAPHQVTVRIDTTGQAGAVSWSYSIDGGVFVNAGVAASATNIGGTGINLLLADGATGTSFVTGDTYSFATPGSWITRQGADAESDDSLRSRCRLAWSALSAIPTAGFYELLARSVPGVGAQVTQAIVIADRFVPNLVDVIVAGTAGVLPPSTITDIQVYFATRSVGTDTVRVMSPTVQTIQVDATITAQASKLVAVQLAVETAIIGYVQAAGINGTLRISSLIERIMEVDGVVDVDGVLLNGVAANMIIGSSIVYALPQLNALDLGWITV